MPTKRVMIPKPPSVHPNRDERGVRSLGIPTVRDRIEQAIIANSLEPEWEAVFE
jgi:RNA-directed DNA polymerase